MKLLLFSVLFFSLSTISATVADIENIKPLFKIGKKIKEVSGAVYDPKRSCLWSIGDSGKGNRTKLAFTKIKTWKTKIIQVLDSENIDWEAIVIDRQKDRLYILDVGDNKRKRKFVYIYEINPNLVRDNEVSYFKKYKVKYNIKRALNVEAGFIKNRHLYLIEKAKRTPVTVLSLDLQADADDAYTANLYGTISGFSTLITDAEIKYSTGEIYLLSYLGIYKLNNFANPARLASTPVMPAFWGQVETLAIIPEAEFIVAQEKGIFFKAE